MKRHLWSLPGVSATLIGLAAPVQAQQVDGRFRLGLEGVVLDSETITLSSESGLVDPTNPTRSVNEVEVSSSNLGLMSSALGVVAGYGLGDSFVLNGRVLWGTQTREVDVPGSQAQESRVFSILPSIEYVFARGNWFRPHLSGLLGFRSGDSSQGDTTVASFSQWRFGAGIGAHMFATESFSIDPMLAFYGISGHEDVGGIEFDGSGTAISLSIGVSGWLGGGPPPSPARPAPTAPTGASRLKRTAFGEHYDAIDPEPEVPEADRVKVRHGIVGVRVGLPDQAELRLVSDPRKSGDTAVVHLLAIDRTGLEGCRSLRLVSDDVAYELRAVRASDRAIGHGAITTLQGTATSEALAEVAGAQNGASIEACERKWPIGVVKRERVKKFLEVVATRVRAVSPGPDAEAVGEQESSIAHPTSR